MIISKSLSWLISLKTLFLISVFALMSCLGGNRPLSERPDLVPDPITEEFTSDIIKNRCIRHEFTQGVDDDLYGRDCIEGKEIKIKSASQGEPIALMSVSGGTDSVVIEEGVDFINQVYDLDYKILRSKGDDKKIPFLLDFIEEGEDFQGIPDTNYSLVFKTVGNYLILYTASENKNDIPYNQRTSMIVEETKEGLKYMTPFIGYPIEYCQAESQLNEQQERTKMVRAKCDSEPSEEHIYLKIRTGQKQAFKYLPKQDILPIDYFEGEWFFAETSIASNVESEIASADSKLAELQKRSDSLVVIDNSGDIKDIARKRLYDLPIQWMEFELAKENEIFSEFGERTDDYKNAIQRSYIKVDFQELEGDIEKVIISPEYFSFVYLTSTGRITKRKRVSLLKKSYLSMDQFQPRKWFQEDADKNFFIVPTVPPAELKSMNLSEEEAYSHIRIEKIDTSLYTKEEKESQTKVITWHFSKNSTKEAHYRDLAQEAIAVYNRAFEIIAGSAPPKIQFHLSPEEKELGDMRYNIINLIKETDLSLDRSKLLGFAPSHNHSDTGQVISGVSNIAIHLAEEIFVGFIRDYTRYEIFQRPKLSAEENKIHVVSDYIRWKIQKECSELEKFIAGKRGTLSDYRTELNDSQLIKACAVKVSRPYLLRTILHEMGHNISLHHNFQCSLDKNNFYKDLEEMKKYFPKANLSDLEALRKTEINPIPKSSCVMEYISFQSLPLPVLGKNDLMVLRYVYEDELELAGHELESPALHPMEVDYKNLDKQKSLASNEELMQKKKVYLNCYEPMVGAKIGCNRRDYGASYKELVENLILDFKRKLNLRYVYDLKIRYGYSMYGQYPLNAPGFAGIHNTFGSMSGYHYKWIQLRDNLLRSESRLDLLDYYVDDKDSVENYKTVIQPKTSQSSKFNQEYKDFHPVADLYGAAVKEVLFKRPLHCRVKSENGVIEDIEFNYLLHTYLEREYGEDLYVIDCYSAQVLDFLNKNKLQLIEQYGIQNLKPNKNIFSTYAVSDSKNQKEDIIPLSYLSSLIYDFKPNPQTRAYEYQGVSRLFLQSFKDLNTLRDMDQRLKNNLLDISQYGNTFEIIRNKRMLLQIYSFITKSENRGINSEEAKKRYKKDISCFINNLGTGEGSFLEEIEYPLRDGHPIDSFQSSFLKKLYMDYLKSGDVSSNSIASASFEKYLKDQEREDIALLEIRKGGEGKALSMVIPVEEDSFCHKMVKKYGVVLKEIEKLEARNLYDLSLLEEYHRKRLHNFRDKFWIIIYTY